MTTQLQERNQASDLTAANDQAGNRQAGPALTPPVDVVEDKDGITLYADLPGVSREQLELQVDAEKLTIEAVPGISVPEQFKPSHTEVGLPRYRRVFTLTKELDTEGVVAELSQGVLKLRIPTAAHAQPRKIEVKVA